MKPIDLYILFLSLENFFIFIVEIGLSLSLVTK